MDCVGVGIGVVGGVDGLTQAINGIRVIIKIDTITFGLIENPYPGTGRILAQQGCLFKVHPTRTLSSSEQKSGCLPFHEYFQFIKF